MLYQDKRALCCIRTKGPYVVSGQKGLMLYQDKRALCCIRTKKPYVVSGQKGIVLCQDKRSYIISGQKGCSILYQVKMANVIFKTVLCHGKKAFLCCVRIKTEQYMIRAKCFVLLGKIIMISWLGFLVHVHKYLVSQPCLQQRTNKMPGIKHTKYTQRQPLYTDIWSCTAN